MLAKKILKTFGLILLIFILSIVGFFAFLTVMEYRPYPVENPGINSAKSDMIIQKNVPMKISTFNIGYGGLGKNQDFFMDGGTMVRPENEGVIRDNLKGINKNIKSMDSDFLLLQEVDVDSKRSYYINQSKEFQRSLDMNNVFALNFKSAFVPFPLKEMMGKTTAGLNTFSRAAIGTAERVSLPVPFKWPVRTVNLKRCLLISRMKIQGSDKELVLVNLHLEAYDDGKGKIAQTKMLSKILKKEFKKGNYVIAGGDWNQTLPGYPKVIIKEKDYWKPGEVKISDMPSEYSFALDPSVPTCRLNHKPYVKGSAENRHYYIDGFIVSSNVKVDKVTTHDFGFEFSDHNPVTMEFRLV